MELICMKTLKSPDPLDTAHGIGDTNYLYFSFRKRRRRSRFVIAVEELHGLLNDNGYKIKSTTHD